MVRCDPLPAGTLVVARGGLFLVAALRVGRHEDANSLWLFSLVEDIAEAGASADPPPASKALRTSGRMPSRPYLTSGEIISMADSLTFTPSVSPCDCGTSTTGAGMSKFHDRPADVARSK